MPMNMIDRRILMSFPFIASSHSPRLSRPSIAREVLDKLSECALLEPGGKLIIYLMSEEFFFQSHKPLDKVESG